MMSVRVVSVFGCIALFGIAVTAAELPLPVAELQRTEPVDFRKEILPIFQRNCLACHREQVAEGGLVLETIQSIHKGGDSGPALVTQDGQMSVLMARASGAEEPLMPPDDNNVQARPLTPEELGLLQLWIGQGAVDRDGEANESIPWQRVPENIRPVYAMDVSPDGQFAAIGRGNRVAVVDLSTTTTIFSLVDSSLEIGEVADIDLVHSIAISPDASRIATGGFRTVRIWRKWSPPVDRGVPLANAAGMIAVKSDQSAAAVVNAIGDIEVWDLAQNQRRHTLSRHADRVTGLVWAGITDRIYSCDQTGLLIAWQASSGAKTFEFDTQTALTTLATSRDGAHLAALDGEGKPHFFRVAAGVISAAPEPQAVDGLTDATAVGFAEKPTPMAIVASKGGGVTMLGLADSQLIRTVDHGGEIDALAVTNDQTKLVTGGRDGKIRLWNIADGQPILTMEGDPETRMQVARANRDAIRQRATLARANQQITQLEELLAKENETLARVTQERKQAMEALAAEDKKLVDAVTLVSSIEANLASAVKDSSEASEKIAAATKRLAAEESTADTIAREIEVQMATLKLAQEAATKAPNDIPETVEAVEDAHAAAQQIETVIAEKQAELSERQQAAAQAQHDIETATRQASDAKSTIEQATKELEAQRKSAAAAEEAKQRSEVERAKRQQVFDASASAQQRAAAAVPKQRAIIDLETRRLSLLESQLARGQVRMTGPGNEVVSVGISRDDASIATAHRDGSVRIYRSKDGQPISAFRAPDRSGPSQVVFLGELICCFGSSSTPSVWSGQVEWGLERTIGSVDDPTTLSDRVTALEFRPDGKSIAVGSGPPSRLGEVKIFAVESGQLVRDFGEVHSDTVLGLEFSPGGRQLASAAADKTIRLLDVATGKVIRSLEGHTHHVLSIAWQDDGQTIASTSADQSVKIWNIETGEQRRTLSGFSKEITDVAFVQASNQIVTACGDGQLRLYDSSNGKLIRSFDAAGDFLFNLSVTPDGKRVLAGGQSGVVRIWTLADGQLVHELR